MNYLITRLAKAPEINAVWDKAPWCDVSAQTIGGFMGDKPEHLPKTEVKLAYTHQHLFVIFQVQDRYVRAVANHYQDNVCRDSCAEFFFSTGPDIAPGYFNLEINCGGTGLFHFQKALSVDRVPIPEQDFKKIDLAHSLPEIVEPEIEEPVTWTLEYAVPFDIIRNYCSFAEPQSEIVWRANFYKCADYTSHPHWLTWSPVDNPIPKFHLPEFFGTLEFE